MLVSNTYLQIWLQILATFTPGIGSLILMLGLVKASLLLAGTSKRVDNWSNGRVAQYGIAIHMGVGVIVLFSILLSRVQVSSNHISPMEVTYAFIATEMLIFPAIGIVYLARALQNNEGNYASIFLLSAITYLDTVLVIISDMLMTNQSVLNIGRTNALEIEGAKISFLLGAFGVRSNPRLLEQPFILLVRCSPNSNLGRRSLRLDYGALHLPGGKEKRSSKY